MAMTNYGYNQISALLATQGNSPEMPTTATMSWLMDGLTAPSKTAPTSLLNMPLSAAYRGLPEGWDAPVSNGPQQWASQPTSLSAPAPTAPSTPPASTQISATNAAGNNTTPKASKAALTTGKTTAKIPQWAWDATANIPDAKARIAIAHVLLKECDPNNIDKVVNHPSDPGGTTKYGIAQKYNKDVDVAKLSIVEAAGIYYNMYWKPNQDLLNRYGSGMGIAVMDTIVHHGVGGAKKILKSIQGSETPATLANARIEELRSKSHAGSFIKGWERRISDVTAFSEGVT